MPMISYAQNREDVLLARVFHDVSVGVYVDVGANDPVVDSVTKHFSDAGWRGINIEPGRIFHKLVAARPRDINVNVAASDRACDIAFYECHAYPGRSSVAAPPPDSVRRTVPALPLRDILTAHAPTTIDFLSIDVEGHERAVLLGNDWARFRPRVVMVEATLPASPVPCHDRWEDVLLNSGYQFAAFDGLNRYYVRAEDAATLAVRFAVPPNVFDDFVPYELALLRSGVPGIQDELRAVAAERDALLQKNAELAARLAPLTGLGHRSLRLGLWVARQVSAAKHPFRRAA